MSHPEPNVKYIFKCDKQLHHVAEKLTSLYREEELFDTTLIAGADNIEVKTHRVVLYLSSEYFRTMFQSGLKESKGEAIRLNMVDGDTLKKIVGFMYTFEIEMTKESIEKVLSAANHFQMKNLIEGCCNLLADQLNTSNCLKFVHLAEQHNYATLYERSLDYSYKNFEQVTNEEVFLKLTEPQLSKFLSQDGVNAVSQEILFLSLIKWLKYDQETRNESMYILLNDFVRFSQLDPEFIVENAESVAHIAKCSKLIFSWLKWHSSEEKRKKQKKLKILLAYNCSGVFRVDSYDPDLNKWSVEDWPQPSKMRRGYGIVITQNKCIIAGGKIGNDYTNSVECLDLETMKWRCLPPMIKQRACFGMAVLNGNIYAVGGVNITGGITLVEKYDFTDDKWTTLAELPFLHHLHYLRAVPVGGKLYVSLTFDSHLKCYDPAANSWIETPNKNEKTPFFGLAASEEYVYAVGGRMNDQGVNTVERYNPRDNTWTVIESMTKKRRWPTCVTVGDKLLVCGGWNKTYHRAFTEYNMKTKEWKDLTQCLETFEGTDDFSQYLSTIIE